MLLCFHKDDKCFSVDQSATTLLSGICQQLEYDNMINIPYKKPHASMLLAFSPLLILVTII